MVVSPTGSRGGDQGYVSIRCRTVTRAKTALVVGAAALVILLGILASLLAERKEAGSGAFEAGALDTEFSRLQAIELEMAELRSLNDKILALAGIHRPLPEGAGDMDPGTRGRWAFSSPTRAPRVGVLSRGFRGQGAEGAHPGVDIPGPAGVPIHAAGGGIVERAELDPHYGNVLIINHSKGVQSLYGHNEELLVQKGDSVWVGQTIARLGNTGRSSAPHLHFEILVDGVAVDPAEFIREYRTRSSTG